MGRTRTFDESQVLARAAEAFRAHGYEGTGVELLLTATGLHRGSLYQAFGSKLGLFVTVLRRALAAAELGGDELDILLVATLELAPRDAEVRELIATRLAQAADPGTLLGRRLLERAGLSS